MHNPIKAYINPYQGSDIYWSDLSNVALRFVDDETVINSDDSEVFFF